jgi:putative heme iron utilization protein
MPQCKIDGCKEQAQPYGKRLCPEHEARRAAKAKAYFANVCFAVLNTLTIRMTKVFQNVHHVVMLVLIESMNNQRKTESLMN